MSVPTGPQPSVPPPSKPPASSESLGAVAVAHEPSKRCPDCAETILADARKCRFCGYSFDSRPELAEGHSGKLAKSGGIRLALMCASVVALIAALLVISIGGSTRAPKASDCLILQSGNQVCGSAANAWCQLAFNADANGGPGVDVSTVQSCASVADHATLDAMAQDECYTSNLNSPCVKQNITPYEKGGH